MEKKEKKQIKWYIHLLKIILGFIIYISIVLFAQCCLKIKRTEAYTNNVILYANEQITDLTGTTWEFNDITSEISNIENINFISNNETFSSIKFSYQEIVGPPGIPSYSVYYMYYDNQIVSEGGIFPLPSPEGEYKTISITGGNDATNTNFINWLQNNATQIINEEFYNITYNLQNVLIIGNKPTQISNLEEINLEIQNFNNYELPQNIMVENASYNWNYETGILTIYNATGNIEITIRAEYISGNYSFIELIDSVVLIPLNTFFNLFNFELFGVNIYALLTATLTLFVIIKILLKVFK